MPELPPGSPDLGTPPWNPPLPVGRAVLGFVSGFRCFDVLIYRNFMASGQCLWPPLSVMPRFAGMDTDSTEGSPDSGWAAQVAEITFD